ncbi:MAG: hypothetical protein K1X91_17010, partial [Bacteriodetes bacterium]|nr:hypothetical protein [Bacteroidota bacterium]
DRTAPLCNQQPHLAVERILSLSTTVIVDVITTYLLNRKVRKGYRKVHKVFQHQTKPYNNT